METKKYRVRILMQSGTTQQWMEEEFEAERFSMGSGYYWFMIDGKQRYYPMGNTIIDEL